MAFWDVLRYHLDGEHEVGPFLDTFMSCFKYLYCLACRDRGV